MEKDSSKEWIKISAEYTKNPKEKIVCPICKEEYLTVTLVEEESELLDIYFTCANCNAKNIMSIAKPYQESMYKMIHELMSEDDI